MLDQPVRLLDALALRLRPRARRVDHNHLLVPVLRRFPGAEGEMRLRQGFDQLSQLGRAASGAYEGQAQLPIEAAAFRPRNSLPMFFTHAWPHLIAQQLWPLLAADSDFMPKLISRLRTQLSFLLRDCAILRSPGSCL